MSARSVSAGSQPAIELICDWYEGCSEYERFFVDDRRTARMVATQQGWICDTNYGAMSSEYCPKHHPRYAPRQARSSSERDD